MTCAIRLTRGASRALAYLPTGVAAAVVEFMYGPMSEDPHRVGRPLRGELEGQHSARRGQYRIRYRVESDEVVICVVDTAHRSDAYRPR